jgi:hypothetical protein
MGAWGYNPFENDEAMEWVSNSIEKPLIEAIKEMLQKFLADPEDDVMKHEVEAAVALLLDFTAYPSRLKYCRFEIAHLVSEARLWDLAIEVIKILRADRNWLADWGSPDKKLQVLDEMSSELELRQKGNKSH